MKDSAKGAAAGLVPASQPSEWTRYDVTPVPKPRMTQRDRWAQRRCVVHYRGYKDMLRFLGVILPANLQVVFVLPMPKTWSAVKRIVQCGGAHVQTPDLDNLLKGLLDGLYEADSTFWNVHATKVWGDTGAIFVREIPPPELPL